jgi:hypothetical protein
MKKLLLSLCTILVAAPVAATVDITVRNLGDTVYLRESGLPYMAYLPTLRSPLQQNQNGISLAASNLETNRSIKVVYRTADDNSSPGCEFILQAVNPLPSNPQSFWSIVKVSAKEVSKSTKVSMQCLSQLTGFDNKSGASSVIFTMKAVRRLAGGWVSNELDVANPDGDPEIQSMIVGD